MNIAMVDFSRGWGGAEQILFSLCIGLKKRGHQVTIFLREDAGNAAKFREAGFITWEIPRKGFAAVKGILDLARIGNRHRFDVVHVHRNHDLLTGKIISVFSGRAPLVITQHCWLGSTSFAIMNLADRIAPVSRFIADGIAATFPRLGNKISVIHNGIDVQSFDNADRDYWSKKCELMGKGPFLGVTGYFYKNQEELVELLPRIRSVFPRVVLVIIGHDSSKVELLVKKVEAVGCADSVHFAGQIPHEEMKHALASLDLQVSAFKKEGFGLSVIEGLAVGTPFVGYRAGGYQEIIIDRLTGCLVEEISDLADTIVSMITEESTSRSDQLKACTAIANRFSLSCMVEAYEALYTKLKGKE